MVLVQITEAIDNNSALGIKTILNVKTKRKTSKEELSNLPGSSAYGLVTTKKMNAFSI